MVDFLELFDTLVYLKEIGEARKWLVRNGESNREKEKGDIAGCMEYTSY